MAETVSGTDPVVVVGGGPAGAAAAITLARAGTDVLVVDKARFPRDKCCGDGLTADALRQLEDLGLRPESVPDWQPVTDVFVRSPVGRTVQFTLPAGQGQFAAVTPGPSSTPPCSTWPGPPGPRWPTATG